LEEFVLLKKALNWLAKLETDKLALTDKLVIVPIHILFFGKLVSFLNASNFVLQSLQLQMQQERFL